MDAFKGLFSKLGSFFPTSEGKDNSHGSFISKFLPWMQVAQGAMGTVGNMGANRSRNSILQAQMEQMRTLANLTPEQVAKGIAALQQPLSSNLTHNVGNTVQAQMAERGLSQAPGVYASTLAQGLAPYQVEMQRQAQDAYFRKLGLPIQARPNAELLPKTTDTSNIWRSLMNRFMGKGVGGSKGGGGSFDGSIQGLDALNNFGAGQGGGWNPDTGTGVPGSTLDNSNWLMNLITSTPPAPAG